MVHRRQGAVGRNQHIITDVNAIAGVQHTTRIEKAALTEQNITIAANRLGFSRSCLYGNQLRSPRVPAARAPDPQGRTPERKGDGDQGFGGLKGSILQRRIEISPSLHPRGRQA